MNAPQRALVLMYFLLRLGGDTLFFQCWLVLNVPVSWGRWCHYCASDRMTALPRGHGLSLKEFSEGLTITCFIK